MGSVGFHTSELYHLIMKFMVLASSVLAAVSGFYHPYAAIGHVYGLKSAPCVNAANVPVPCAAGHFYGKRSADAEAGVFAAVPFGDPSGLDPITQGANPATQGFAPYAYAGYLGYAAHPYAYGKREAEADAQFLAAPYAYAAPHAVAAAAYGAVHSSLV